MGKSQIRDLSTDARFIAVGHLVHEKWNNWTKFCYPVYSVVGEERPTVERIDMGETCDLPMASPRHPEGASGCVTAYFLKI